jgi:hypothetical protein
MTPGLEDPQPTRPRLRWTLMLRLVAALLLVLAGLAISGSPSVEAPAPPSPANIDLARVVLKQLAGEGRPKGARLDIVLSQAELDGLSALVNQVLAPVRVEARLEQPAPPVGPKPAKATSPGKTTAAIKAQRKDLPPPALVARISRKLPLGAWLNVEARATSVAGGKGLPIVQVQVGRLPLPTWLSRLAMRRVWLMLLGDDKDPPSLDESLPYVSIGAKQARAVLIHPGRNAAYSGLSRFGGIHPDPRWLATSYCALTRHPDADLATIVRYAWHLPRPVRLTPDEQNRALMIAIAMRTLPEYRKRLAGDAMPLLRHCNNPPEPLIMLAGRHDLAKHWAMSAALSASLGGKIAQSLGVWKELSDSLTGGTGFSFVDIAADRSGERFANAATDPQLARFLQTRLAAVTDPQLLAPEALDKPEGLNAEVFERIYDNVESAEYKAAVGAIDTLLDNVGVPKP